jgi:hypothetical protein
MKWYWIVVWTRPTGTADSNDSGTIRSQPFEREQDARNNLDARLNQPVPDVGLPKGAYIASYSVELKR